MTKTTKDKSAAPRGERLLSDARVRTATRDNVGSDYLSDGGGLRIRLLPPSQRNLRGAKLAEFYFRSPTTGARATIGLGTLFAPFTDDAGVTRPFTLADARAARDAARAQVADGIDPRDARRLAQHKAVEAQRAELVEFDSRRTVQQAFVQWRDLYLAKHRKDGGEFVQALFDRDVLPVIGDIPLAALKRVKVSDALDQILARDARRKANMALALIRQFSNWCLARDWIQSDPTVGLSKAKVGGKDRPRDRALSSLELVALRDALPASGLRPRLQHAIWLILATGCRVGEVSAARVADFDLKGAQWHIPETKNGKAHVVHLSEFAIEHVRALFELGDGSQWLLPAREPRTQAGDAAGDEGQPDERDDDRPINDKAVAKAVGDRQRETPLRGRAKASNTLALAGGKWTPHDLRRTMATRMRDDLRVSSDVIEKCLNHTPQGIVGVYQTGPLMAERQEAFTAWGKELQRLMSLDVSNVVAMPAARRTAA